MDHHQDSKTGSMVFEEHTFTYSEGKGILIYYEFVDNILGQ